MTSSPEKHVAPQTRCLSRWHPALQRLPLEETTPWRHSTCRCRRGTCYNIRTVHRTTKAISSLHVVTISSKTFPVETSNLHWNCCCVFAQHHSVLSVVRCVSRENFIGYRTFRWGPSQSTTLHKGVYIMSAQTYTHMSIKWSWRDALLKHMHHKRKNI